MTPTERRRRANEREAAAWRRLADGYERAAAEPGRDSAALLAQRDQALKIAADYQQAAEHEVA